MRPDEKLLAPKPDPDADKRYDETLKRMLAMKPKPNDQNSGKAKRRRNPSST